jgi:hypothetical protein
VRNFLPLVSQGQHLAYQFETPTTRVWRERFDRGELNDAQSLFWRTPKPTEELFDLATDPDEVCNLAADPAQRERLDAFRAALDAHLRATRDLGFLPEAEQHARAAGVAPYTLARDEARYPLERILAAAHRAAPRVRPSTPVPTIDRSAPAGRLVAVERLASANDSDPTASDPETPEALDALLTDPDAAVRFWGVQAVRVRGAALRAACAPRLRALLADPSPSVRVAAAHTLAASDSAATSGATGGDSATPGTAAREDDAAALATLARCVDPMDSGFFASLAALEAIDSLGERATPLHATLGARSWKGTAPHPRYQSYPARLVTAITGIAAPAESPERN